MIQKNKDRKLILFSKGHPCSPGPDCSRQSYELWQRKRHYEAGRIFDSAPY